MPIEGEFIVGWDGPLMDICIVVQLGVPSFYLATPGESHSPFFSTDMLESSIHENSYAKIEYIRTDRLDQEGRVYYEMRKL